MTRKWHALTRTIWSISILDLNIVRIKDQRWFFVFPGEFGTICRYLHWEICQRDWQRRALQNLGVQVVKAKHNWLSWEISGNETIWVPPAGQRRPNYCFSEASSLSESSHLQSFEVSHRRLYSSLLARVALRYTPGWGFQVIWFDIHIWYIKLHGSTYIYYIYINGSVCNKLGPGLVSHGFSQ